MIKEGISKQQPASLQKMHTTRTKSQLDCCSIIVLLNLLPTTQHDDDITPPVQQADLYTQQPVALLDIQQDINKHQGQKHTPFHLTLLLPAGCFK